MIIREMKPTDYGVLAEFLYQAVFLPHGAEPLPRDIINRPEIFIYIDSFGKKDDLGVVAEQDGIIVGAAWTRVIPAFGHIDDETPELAISVLPGYRNQGIGTKMLEKLFDLLAEQGYSQTSLSVQKLNPALRMYQRMGYLVVKENGDDYIMLKDLSGKKQALGISLGLCFGSAFGIVLGIVSGNIGLWMPIGVALGLSIGSAWCAASNGKTK